MEKSIFRTVLFYASIQIAFIFCSSLTAQVAFNSVFLYVGLSAILHIILYIFLMRLRSNFFNISTGQQLTRINLANRITLLRISSLPTIAFLLRHKEIAEIKVTLPILLGLLFLTDSFDGQVARKGKQITRMGTMLDSISDYVLLGVISIVYYRNNIVPHWFFFLITLRLFLQGLGMFIFIIMKKPVEIKSTWGGKITIATTMTLYVVELVRLYLPADSAPLFKGAEYFSGAIIFVLYFEKALIFFRQGKKVSAERKSK
jgi:CDP-diacylglycerol--glycerol-3-phosphate 3-phosphatidyltransferase